MLPLPPKKDRPAKAKTSTPARETSSAGTSRPSELRSKTQFTRLICSFLFNFFRLFGECRDRQEKQNNWRASPGLFRIPANVLGSLFLTGGEADEQALAALAAGSGSVGDQFYAALYLSLYYESLGEATMAERRMREAVRTDYARGGGRSDPMVELANVAMTRRGWAAER